jgi:hypothetical protein
MRDRTLWPPADSPKIVILFESPPNNSIFLFTHFNAWIMSKVPKLDVLSTPS